MRITIPVKPYVKQWIMANFGNPPNFRKNKADHDFLLSVLSKDPENGTINNNMFSEQLIVFISMHDFERFGSSLSTKSINEFGKYYEKKAKAAMYITVATAEALGAKLKDAIFYFQERYGFTEDTWSYESIKKDFSRNAHREKIDLEPIISALERIAIINHHKLGMLTDSFYEEYNRGRGLKDMFSWNEKP